MTEEVKENKMESMMKQAMGLLTEAMGEFHKAKKEVEWMGRSKPYLVKYKSGRTTRIGITSARNDSPFLKKRKRYIQSVRFKPRK